MVPEKIHISPKCDFLFEPSYPSQASYFSLVYVLAVETPLPPLKFSMISMGWVWTFSGAAGRVPLFILGKQTQENPSEHGTVNFLESHIRMFLALFVCASLRERPMF